MTRGTIVTAVQDAAFDASLVTHIREWITAREAEVWQYTDWPQKESTQLNLTVTGGTATVALPTGMTFTSQGIHVFDNYGQELASMRPADFYSLYGAAPSSPVPSSNPAAWTLTTDPSSGALQFRVGPTPGASATFTIQGWTLPIKRTNSTTWSIGTMSADSDLPWWPDDYHYFLVPGVIAWGGRQYDMLDWQALEQDFQSGLERLKRELLPVARGETDQWGDLFTVGY